MTIDELTLVTLPIGTLLLDRLIRPRCGRTPISAMGRSLAGTWLLIWMMISLFGFFLMFCGNIPVSAGLSLGLLALIAVASNAKHAMLGEPLLFSDLALVGAIFRHPQFYLSAVVIWQRVVAGFIGTALFALLTWLFVPTLPAHIMGLGLLTASLAVLAVSLKSAPIRHLAKTPSAHSDVLHHGLLPTLLLYWLRWYESRNPPPCREEQRIEPDSPPHLVIMIQCESFADPAELFADPNLTLPGLASARKNAWRWGNLLVSGFGAYTMRTEYGVLFGIDEEELGFRRYDPFLTALGDATHALPARLKGAGWRCLFAHPHDMQFYHRDRIMPTSGFDELVGEGRFTPPNPGDGRYVTDAAVAEEIINLAETASEPTLIYAVTIENHGPWAPDGHPSGDLKQSYLRLVRNSDAMLTALVKRLGSLGRPAMLVFFGDHRPSIPGATSPSEDRHTPYVIIRLDDTGQIVVGCNQQANLTPAELHHTVLAAILGEVISYPEPS